MKLILTKRLKNLYLDYPKICLNIPTRIIKKKSKYVRFVNIETQPDFLYLASRHLNLMCKYTTLGLGLGHLHFLYQVKNFSNFFLKAGVNSWTDFCITFS